MDRCFFGKIICMMFPCKGVVELEVMDNWRSEPSFLWKESAWFFCVMDYHESLGRKDKSRRPCLCLTHDSIDYSLQKTRFYGSMPC